MSVSLFWTILLSIVMVLMAVLGGFVATTSRGYQITFAVLGILALIFILFQNNAIRDEQQEEQEKQRELSGKIAALEELLKGTKPDPTKIKVLLGHADAYHYLDATEHDPNRDINPDLPIEFKFRPHIRESFPFGVNNHNKSVPLVNVRLYLSLDPADKLEVTGDSEKDNYWRKHKDSEEYWFEWKYINANDGRMSWHPLEIKFPHPGTYLFRFAITGNFERRESRVLVRVLP